MRRGLKIALAFLAGLVVGWAMPIAAYIVATNFLGLFDRDGGGAMGAIFLIGPASGILCGTVAALIVAARTRRENA